MTHLTRQWSLSTIEQTETTVDFIILKIVLQMLYHTVEIQICFLTPD